MRLSAPKDAAKHGISMVYQETSLVPQLTVAKSGAIVAEFARPEVAAEKILHAAIH